MASVPCRCGHSWTVGPSPRSGTPANSGRASMRGSCAGATTVDGLGRVRRAGDVGDDAAGPDQAQRRGEQLALQRGQLGDVVGRCAASGPPGAGAARRGRCTARRAGRGRNRRRRGELAGVADAHLDAPSAAVDLAHQVGPVRAQLVGGRAGRAAAGGERGEQRGLAAGTGAQVEPALVAPVERGGGQGERARAGCPRPARRRGGRAPRRARPGSPPSQADARTASTARAAPPASATSSSRSMRPGPGDQVGLRALVVGGQGRAVSARSPSVVRRARRRRPRRSIRVRRAQGQPPQRRRARRPAGRSRRPSRRPPLAQDRVDEAGRAGVPVAGRGRRWWPRPRAAGCGCAAAGRRRAGAGTSTPASTSARPVDAARRGSRRGCRRARSGAVAELGGQRGVAAGQPALARAAAAARGWRTHRPARPRAAARRAAARAGSGAGRRPRDGAALSQGVPRARVAPRGPSRRRGIGRLPGGCTRAEFDRLACRCRPATACDRRRSRRPPGRARRRRPHRAELEPLAAERRPRARARACTARISRSTCSAGAVQSTRASSDGDLAARSRPRRPAAGAATRVPSAMPSMVATSRPAPLIGQPAEQVAGGVAGPDRLGDDAEHRAGVEAGLDAERRRAGDLVAVQDRVLHRGGAAPGRQQREVQVHPAVRGDGERGRRQQRAVGDDRDSSRVRARRSRSRKSGSPGRGGRQHRRRRPRRPAAATGDGAGARPAAGAGRRAGDRPRRPRAGASRAAPAGTGTAAAGVPAKTSLTAAPDHRASPRVVCGLTLTDAARSSPDHSASRIARMAALRASASSRSTNSTPSRWSVSCCRQRASVAVPSMVIGSPYMFCPCATTLARRRQSKARPGDGQAALRAVLLLVAREVQHRVDQVARLVVVDVVGEHPQPDADLRRGQPGPRRVEHRLGEVGDQGAQLLVEVGHRLGRRAQHRVAEQADGLHGHRASLRTSALDQARRACHPARLVRMANERRDARSCRTSRTPTPAASPCRSRRSASSPPR